MNASRSPLRGRCATKKDRIGTPTTTPRAYAEMTCPAVGTETSRPSAISGRTPIVTNSVVPMAKPPTASARMGSTACLALRSGGAVSSVVADIRRFRSFQRGRGPNPCHGAGYSPARHPSAREVTPALRQLGPRPGRGDLAVDEDDHAVGLGEGGPLRRRPD